MPSPNRLRRSRDLRTDAGQELPDGGFTLLELMLALLLLAIVLAGLAPAYYGTLRAADLSSEHSVANGIAIAATEQLRSFPYFDLGYTTTDYQTPGQAPPNGGVGYPCIAASSNTTVQVTTSPLEGLATSQTVSNVAYSIQRCVYWIDSSVAGDTQAYKQTVVTVGWTLGRVHSVVSQTSAVYPGGESPYTTAQNNEAPGTTTATTAAVSPAPPAWVSHATDPTFPYDEIDLVWSEPSTTLEPAAKYEVDYATASNYSGSGYLSLTPGTYTAATFSTPGTAASPNVISVSASTTYYIEVWAIAADGTRSTTPSDVESVTTGSTPQTCVINNLVVNPTNAVVDANGRFASGYTTFSLSVNATNACNNVTVSYNTNGPTLYQAPMSGSGTLTGTAGNTSTKWDTGNHTFTVYTGGTQYVPSGGGAVQVQVDITQCKNC